MSRARVWTSSGSFNNVSSFLKEMKHRNYLKKLDKFGKMGVDALRLATPKDTGLTSESWTYEIVEHSYGLSMIWNNTNVVSGNFNVALNIQYGHGKKGGGYVRGIDYINPALRPVFDMITEEVWKVVKAS